MAGDWYYVQNDKRQGPVTFDRLKALAAGGWLAPSDLVWREGMAHWIPAKDAEGLFANPLGRVLQKTIAGLRPATDHAAPTCPANAAPLGIPAKQPKPERRKAPLAAMSIEWEELAPRHIVAACGGFLAALGIAFTAIAQSSVALAFTLSGLFIAAVGLYVEIGKLLRQATENIGKASKEAADRRLRAKELAIEKQRLDLEAARLAQDKAAREAPVAAAAAVTNQQLESMRQSPSGMGQVLVINQAPVKRWSPGLAAVLSFFVPGLGQLYKGQIINGIIWFLFVSIGYVALVLPGLVLHFFCVLGALSGNPWTEGTTTVVRQ